MTQFKSHPEIDDELLSAYLDDELSPDERARVDERLASDPTARKLLDELQSAAKAIQGLPRESVGHDLRESVLQRAEEALLTSGDAHAAATRKRASSRDSIDFADSLPRLTIGRTKRGWTWAALAMAAGLLIMFWYRDDRQQGSNLPEVARKTAVETDKVASADRRQAPELRNWSAPMPPTEMVESPAESSDDHRELLAFGAPAARAARSESSGEAAPEPAPVALDSGAPAARGMSPTSGSGPMPSVDLESDMIRAPANESTRLDDGAMAATGGPLAPATSPPAVAASESTSRQMRETLSAPPAGGETSLGLAVTDESAADALAKAPAQAGTDHFVIVNVVVKQDALDDKAFDRLLVSNGIVVEELAEKEMASPAGTLNAEREGVGRTLDRFSGQESSNDQRPDEEAVLVVAPQSAIESCLAELKNDPTNFLGVSIEDSSALAITEDKSEAAAETTTRKLATDFGVRYNRGTVPPQSAERARRLYAFHFDYDADEEQQQAGRGGFAGGRFGAERTSERAEGRFESLEQQVADPLPRGRARRMRLSESERSEVRRSWGRGAAVADEQSTSAVQQLEKLHHEAKQFADRGGENLHVLFVLSPESGSPAAAATSPPSPATSPATENRPE